MREIHIRPVLNGFIVKVGCQEIVFTNIIVLSDEITRYQENPTEVEKEYMERAVNLNLKPVERTSGLDYIERVKIGTTNRLAKRQH